MADPINILKSILDVTTRIENHLKHDSKKESKVSGAAKGIFKSKKTESTSSKTDIGNIKGILSILNKSENLKEKGEGLNLIGRGISSIASGLNIFSEVNPKSGARFITFTSKLLEVFDSSDVEKLEKGGNALNSIGIGLMTFSKALLKSSLMLMIAIPLIPIIGLSIKIFTNIFEWAGRGKNFKSIKKGGEAIGSIGSGLMKFAGGLATLGLVTGLIIAINPLLIAAMPAMIGIFGATVGLIGLAAPFVRRGSMAVGMMGLGLIAFSGGLLAMTLAISFAKKQIGEENILKTLGGFALVLGTLAATFALAGLVSPFIMSGALAFGAVGLSLLVMSVGIGSLAKVAAKTKEDDIKKIPDLIKTPGMAFAKLGFVAPFVLAGAGVGLVIGPALSGIARGMEDISKIDLKKFNEDRIKNILITLSKSFEVLGQGETGTRPNTLMLLTGIDMGKTPIERGISNAALIGKALSSLAAGVGTWADLQNIPLIEGYDKKGNPILSNKKVNVNKALDQITYFLPKVAIAFEKFADRSGGKGMEQMSITKMLLGNDLSKTNMQRGISNAIKMGRALSSIATGVGTWADLQNIPLIIDYDKKGNPIYGKEKADVNKAVSQISIFLPKIRKVFEDFAEDKDSGFSILKLLVGNDLSRSPMQRGLGNAMKMGRALTTIAEGIGTWADLQNIPLIEGYNKEGKPIYGTKKVNINRAIANAGLSIKLLSDTLLKVAGEPERAGGIMGWIGLTRNKKASSLSRAVEAIAPLGDILSGFGEAFKTFADIENIKIIEGYEWNEKAQRNIPKYSKKSIGISKISSNVKNVLNTIADSLVSVAGQPQLKASPSIFGVKLWNSYPKTKAIGKAVDALGPFGEMFSSFAEGIKTFANIENIKIIEGYEWNEKLQKHIPKYSPDSISISKVAGNAKTAITTIADALAQVAGQPSLPNATGFNLFSSYPKTKAIGKAADALGPIGEMFGGFAQGIKTFADLRNIKIITGWKTDPKTGQQIPIYDVDKVNVEEVAKTAGSALDIISTTLSKYSIEENIKMKASLNASKDVGDILTRIAEGLKTFAKLESIPTIKGWKGTKPIFGESVNVNDVIKNVDRAIVSVLDTLKKVDGSTGKSNKKGKTGVFAFEKFSQDLTKLAMAADKFKSFADSFERIAKSMGVFSNNFNKMSEDDIKLYTVWTKSLLKFAEIDIKSYETNVEKVKDKFDFGLDELKGKAKEVFESDNAEEIEENLETENEENKSEELLRSLVGQVSSLNGQLSEMKDILRSELDVNVIGTIKTEQI